MNSRERFLRVMNYESVDRTPFRPTGAWPETTERWRREGMDAPGAPTFKTDSEIWSGGWFFPNPPFERRVVEETDDTVLYVNHEGILMRELKNNPMSSMPQFVRFPVETRDDFRRFRKAHLQPDLAARIGPDWQAQLAQINRREAPFIVISDRWGGFFGPLRNLTGVERLCMLFHDDPAFVEEMMDAIADFIIAVMQQILDHTTVDVYGFWEDMAYKTGPLIGPDMMRKYMLPRYRRVVDAVTARGVRFIALDSDGQIDPLIPVWLDAGINTLYPFEAQAGMDVTAVRRKYGRQLRIWGGIDKRALARSPAAIDAELARVAPLVRDGGYIPGLDHSCPPDISFANYCYYMEHLPEIL